jgi:hypothetical protein
MSRKSAAVVDGASLAEGSQARYRIVRNDQEDRMDNERSKTVRPQAHQKHPDPWQQDLNPDHLAGQNIGPPSGELGSAQLTAFHLRKQGHAVGGLDDEELKQVPLVPAGSRLQQGATYVNLAGNPYEEFTATAEITASPGDAYAPKDRVPYEIWNRLIGEPKPGQE